MTQSPIANDALDSLLSPNISERQFAGPRDIEDIEHSSNSTSESQKSTPILVSPPIRPTGRHSQLDPEVGSINPARNPSPTYLKASDGELQETILASFAPRITLIASEDTDEIAKEKGFAQGFYGLLRPFGEQVSGKVVVRDSAGASKAWENFSIRFIRHGQDVQPAQPVMSPIDQDQSKQRNDNQGEEDHSPRYSSSSSLPYEQQNPIDIILETSLQSKRFRSESTEIDHNTERKESHIPGKPSPAYVLYLRKLLSGALQTPYETFSHPVACIIAVSSRSQRPLEKIRQLYSASGRGNAKIPPWVGVDYLRYYVLVHDEDRDDVTKSTALFDLMKRHFGLHCCLLRIRSVQCVETDEDSSRIPECVWTSTAEEKEDIEEFDRYHDWDEGNFVFDSDATAIRSFIREMVTQSMVPYMEGRIVTWNDQIASKRRGIGGRFMSLSKKWTGFGSSRGSSTTTASGSNPYSSNFDVARGFYLPESPEAMMRQLADYAFMLRDFKLAFSTYESLRTDFSNDKAWVYHASASELAGVSYLLLPQVLSNRTRFEIVDQKIDAALYSYLARCSLSTGAIRALILTMELLTGKGPAAADEAAKWAIRLLDLAILTPLQQALITERIADIHRLQSGSGSLGLGSRRRQSVLWNTLSTSLWSKLVMPAQAMIRLREARTMMEGPGAAASDLPFPKMYLFFAHLGQKELGIRHETPFETGQNPVSDHYDDSDYEINERLDQPFTSIASQSEVVPAPVDAGGFSTVDANQLGVEQA
ncbi:MAG: hypothetical protein Q9216_001765 [Gyalolechia sp. 2 TL-2023]